MIEFVALLLVATLFGGMMLYSLGFAPMVFSALPGEEASRFIRAVFPWYYLFVIVTAGSGGLILLMTNGLSAALALAIAASTVCVRHMLMPLINAARDKQLQGDVGAKRRFGLLHGFSVAMNFVQLFAAGYVLYRFL